MRARLYSPRSIRQGYEQERDVSRKDQKRQDGDRLMHRILSRGHTCDADADESGVTGKIRTILKFSREHQVLGKAVEQGEQNRGEIPPRLSEITFLEIDALT